MKYFDTSNTVEPFLDELPHNMTKRFCLEIKAGLKNLEMQKNDPDLLRQRYWRFWEVILDDARDILAQYFNGDTQRRLLEFVTKDQVQNSSFEEDYNNFIDLFTFFAVLDHKANQINSSAIRPSDIVIRAPALLDTLIIPIIFYLFLAKAENRQEKEVFLKDISIELDFINPVTDSLRDYIVPELLRLSDKSFVHYQLNVKQALLQFESSHFRFATFEEKRNHLNSLVQEVFRDETDNYLSNLDELFPHEDIKCLINYGSSLEEDVLSFWKARYKLNNYSRGYFIVFPKRAKEEDETISRSQDKWLTEETKIWYVSTEKSHKVYEVQTKDKEGAIKLRGDAHKGLLFLAWYRFSYPEEKNVDVSFVRRWWLGENPIRYGTVIRSASKTIEKAISKSPFEFNKIKTKSDLYELKDVIPFIYI